MKYIDSEKLIAEIERLKEETPIGICEYDKGEENGRYEVLNHLLSTITSLQQEQPSLPSGLDDAAEKYSENILANNEDLQDAIEDAFIAGAKWMNEQMKMPTSTKLISEWHNVKTILEEKDFRGDEWRLAYNAFMYGFSRGINTQKTEK